MQFTSCGLDQRYYFSTTTSNTGAHMLSGSWAVPSLDPGAISIGELPGTRKILEMLLMGIISRLDLLEKNSFLDPIQRSQFWEP